MMGSWARLAALGALLCAIPACSSNTPQNQSGSGPSVDVVQPSTLTFCTELAFPPMESLQGGKPVGVDISIGDEIAHRLSLTPDYLNIAFDGLIPALQSHKCDAILSALAHTPERAQQVDFIDYLNWTGALIVPVGNPKKIVTDLDLCGLSAGSQVASTGLDNLNDINTRCTAAGKPTISITTYQQDPQGVLALATDKVDAYMTDAVPATNNLKNGAKYDIAIDSIAPVRLGIAVGKGNDKLRSAVQNAVGGMQADGTMHKLLDQYGLSKFQLGVQ